MSFKLIIKILVVVTFTLVIIGSIYMINHTNSIGQEYRNMMIETRCVGVIDSIDKSQASKYFFVGDERFAFGRVESEMIQFANVGDSIVKESNSADILIIKESGEEKVFTIY